MSTPQTQKLSGKNILLVEDDFVLSRMYAKFFRSAGATVTQAFNGEEALDVLSNSSVDIILLDLGMPRMDGKETVERIKENSQTKTIPIIILSNTTMEEGRQGYTELTNAGVTDIVRKYELSLD